MKRGRRGRPGGGIEESAPAPAPAPMPAAPDSRAESPASGQLALSPPALASSAAVLPTTAETSPLASFFVSAEERALNRDALSGEGFGRAGLRSAEVSELLAFWVADEEYAVDMVEIQEIIKVPTITLVPRAASAFLGIISLRGTIVPVVDLRAMLGLERRPVGRGTRILVLRGDDEPVGFLVDRVSSVVRLEEDAIQTVPRTMQRDTAQLLRGVGRDGERMLIVLDLPALLAAVEQLA